MWNQSIRCSLKGCRYSCTRRTFSPPSDMNTTWLLHPLRLHQLPQSPSRFLVVGLNEPETLRRGYFALILPPKSDDAFARDHFEPSLLVRRANVTAVDANRDRTIW